MTPTEVKITSLVNNYWREYFTNKERNELASHGLMKPATLRERLRTDEERQILEAYCKIFEGQGA